MGTGQSLIRDSAEGLSLVDALILQAAEDGSIQGEFRQHCIGAPLQN